MKRCYLFDIDGTIADLSHRLHYITGETKDWRAFFAAAHADVPIPHMIELAKRLWATIPIIFVSGRSDECKEATMDWLTAQGFGFMTGHGPGEPRYTWNLYMRKAGDHRPDNLVKSNLLDMIIADGWTPIMAFDDRDQVVKMWRDRGVPCAQVAPGDF